MKLKFWPTMIITAYISGLLALTKSEPTATLNLKKYAREYINQSPVQPRADESVVQRVIFDSTKPCRVMVCGDSHGEADQVANFIEHLKKENIIDAHNRITDPSTYIIFLGDYINGDRHADDVQLLAQLLEYATTNPQQFLLLRGNHETDLSASWIQQVNVHGDSQSMIKDLFNTLPTAIYLTTAQKVHGVHPTALFCHGGPSPVYRYGDFMKGNAQHEIIAQQKNTEFLHQTFGDFGRGYSKLTPSDFAADARKKLNDHLNNISDATYPLEFICRGHEHRSNENYQLNALPADIKLFTHIFSSKNRRTTGPSYAEFSWSPTEQTWLVSHIVQSNKSWNPRVHNIPLSQWPLTK